VAHAGRVRSAVDLKHVGLIVSSSAAVSLRFLSDFSVGTLQEQAALAGVDPGRPASASFGALVLGTLGHELRRDWFNLSPQAPLEIIGVVVLLLAAYAVLRRAVGAEAAAATVLVSTPFVPLMAIVSACAWFIVRAARPG
jgi:hypothetical protein